MELLVRSCSIVPDGIVAADPTAIVDPKITASRINLCFIVVWAGFQSFIQAGHYHSVKRRRYPIGLWSNPQTASPSSFTTGIAIRPRQNENGATVADADQENRVHAVA